MHPWNRGLRFPPSTISTLPASSRRQSTGAPKNKALELYGVHSPPPPPQPLQTLLARAARCSHGPLALQEVPDTGRSCGPRTGGSGPEAEQPLEAAGHLKLHSSRSGLLTGFFQKLLFPQKAMCLLMRKRCLKSTLFYFIYLF